MKWISVKDELPDEGEEVICFASKLGRGSPNQMLIGWHENDKWGYSDGDDYDCNPDYWIITHWMPLPKSPLDESDDSDLVELLRAIYTILIDNKITLNKKIELSKGLIEAKLIPSEQQKQK